MTIKGLQTDQPGLPRAGIIRLGHKVDTGKKDKWGNQLFRPVETAHFVLTDAPEVAEALGTNEPTELKIYFPFDEIDLVFPAYMHFWQASALVCRGDGEQIVYAIDPATGKATVRDGIAIADFTEGKQHVKAGQFMRCPGPERNLYPKCEKCKPNAMLLVLLREVPRLAYYQIATTSIHNIIDLTQQLNTVRTTIRTITGEPKLTGVPFILKRVAREISAPKTDKAGNPNGRQRVKKYFLQLEIDPDWVLRMLMAQRRLADPLDRLALPAVASARAEEEPKIEIIDPAAPAPAGFANAPVWEPEPTDADFEEVDTTHEAASKPVQSAEVKANSKANSNGKAPEIRRTLEPAELKEVLEKKIAKSTLIDPETKELLPIHLHPFGKRTANLVSAKFQQAFKSDPLDEDEPNGKPSWEDQYHVSLNWLFGKTSAKDLTAAQGDALLDWLLNGDKSQMFNARVIEPAPEEAHRIYRQALLDQGQIDMFDTPEAQTELDEFFGPEPSEVAEEIDF